MASATRSRCRRNFSGSCVTIVTYSKQLGKFAGSAASKYLRTVNAEAIRNALAGGMIKDMDTATTILSANPTRDMDHKPANTVQDVSAGRIVSEAMAAAGSYAQRAGATWLLWLRTNSETPPHEDF